MSWWLIPEAVHAFKSRDLAFLTLELESSFWAFSVTSWAPSLRLLYLLPIAFLSWPSFSLVISTLLEIEVSLAIRTNCKQIARNSPTSHSVRSIAIHFPRDHLCISSCLSHYYWRKLFNKLAACDHLETRTARWTRKLSRAVKHPCFGSPCRQRPLRAAKWHHRPLTMKHALMTFYIWLKAVMMIYLRPRKNLSKWTVYQFYLLLPNNMGQPLLSSSVPRTRGLIWQDSVSENLLSPEHACLFVQRLGNHSNALDQKTNSIARIPETMRIGILALHFRMWSRFLSSFLYFLVLLWYFNLVLYHNHPEGKREQLLHHRTQWKFARWRIAYRKVRTTRGHRPVCFHSQSKFYR